MRRYVALLIGWVTRFVSPAMVVNSTLHEDAKVEGGSKFYFSSLGRHSFCGYRCEVFHAEIGAFTSIADGVVISGGRHPMEWAAMSPVFYSGRDSVKAKFSEFDRPPVKVTRIGSDVWLGRSVIVLEGVSIGHGAVVGAGSVVTKDVPAYSIVAGNPARHIRFRFDEEVRNKLLLTRWWERSDEEIAENAHHVKSPLSFFKSFED